MIQLIWMHFLADFIAQDSYMAEHKSKHGGWLALHGAFYTLGMLLVLPPDWAIINGIVHTLVDAVTSRVTAKLWVKKELHWFFCVVGLDHAIHMTCLWVTWEYLI